MRCLEWKIQATEPLVMRRKMRRKISHDGREGSRGLGTGSSGQLGGAEVSSLSGDVEIPG